MARYLTEEEIKKAKVDKTIRDKMGSEIEEKMGMGQVYPEYSDTAEFGGQQFHRVVTEEAIKAFCDGIGNVNPLYRSRDYGKNSIHGGIIAPPQFLEAICTFAGAARITRKLDYVASAYNVGSRAEYFKIIRPGDEFRVYFNWIGPEDKTREGTSLQFLNHGRKVYKNQRDETVAIVTINNMMMVRPPAGLYSSKVVHDRKPYKFSEQEVENWYQLTEQEEIRGATPRFWEDTNVGDQLPPTHHVFTMTETMAFRAGCGRSFNWRIRMALSKEGWRRLIDPESGLPDFADHHVTDAGAQRNGTPRANCEGVLIECWLGNLVTNWMGDAGFLKKLNSPVRQTLLRESLALCKGQVVKKYIEGDEYLVDLRITMEDHEGGFVVPNGSATIVLPSKVI